MTSKEMPRVALLHYSAPPVIGGVENVILAHVRLFVEAGYRTTVIAGKGAREALPSGAELVLIPELDSQHPRILEISQALDQGNIPPGFEEMTTRLVDVLASVFQSIDFLIVHNVFTKHFNLPLTAALFRMLDAGMVRHCAAWCHDMSWTSPRSRSKMHEGYPWEFLRTQRSEIIYVTVSNGRQQELAGLFGCRPQEIQVIYNGVDPAELLALSEEGLALIDRLDMWNSDLNLLMPVRVTQAKNIELAIRVAAALKEKGIHPNIVVTGPPDPHDPSNMEYFQHLLELRKHLGVDQQVHFVYQSGSNPVDPLIVDMPLVAELFRVSDALFMPSRREGFGMPILEAGLVGIPVFSTDHVPAANEIGGQDVIQFSAEADPGQVAGLILEAIGKSPMLQLRRRVRQRLTWRGIFNRQMIPLLEGNT